MSIRTALHDLAVDLADAAPGFEYQVWTKEQLAVYLQEGINQAYTARPDLFSERVLIKVDGCDFLADECDCEFITSVIGQATESGRLIRRLREWDEPENLSWTGRVCNAHTRPYKVYGYTLDRSTSSITIYPTPPYGESIYLLVNCSRKPTDFSLDKSYPYEIETAAKQWALYRAKMVDSENNTTLLQAATIHRDTFFQLVNVQRQYLIEDEDRAERK